MTHRFIAACRRQPVDRLPVWMMRQAGRYQPSYRAVREKVSFLELCRSPELIAKVTIAPIDEFGFDAAILFSDILVHLPAMGLDLSFEKGEKGKGDGGPKIANPVRTRAHAVDFAGQAWIRLVVTALAPDDPRFVVLDGGAS